MGGEDSSVAALPATIFCRCERRRSGGTKVAKQSVFINTRSLRHCTPAERAPPKKLKQYLQEERTSIFITMAIGGGWGEASGTYIIVFVLYYFRMLRPYVNLKNDRRRSNRPPSQPENQRLALYPYGERQHRSSRRSTFLPNAATEGSSPNASPRYRTK